MGTFQRQYIGEDIWVDIDEVDLRRALEGNYTDCDEILPELEKGHVIRTPFALYRLETVSQP